MVCPQLKRWVAGIEQLSRAARRYPQSAYAGLTKCFQMEWTYYLRVLQPSVRGDLFAPVETALSECSILALLQDANVLRENHNLRQLLALVYATLRTTENTVMKLLLGLPSP